jgi:predicted nuclease of restriction endonuclease-like (RecB) superfamily
MQLSRQQEFTDIIRLIKQSQWNAIKSVNTELINLYWNIGQYISDRVEQSDWGQSVVKELADYLSRTELNMKGFSDKNLWRMKQFYETYKDFPKLSAVLREISWTNNLTILSRAKTLEEKEFYLRLTSQEKYSSRELERQINSGVFERTMLGNTKLSAVLREINSNAINCFKDDYVFEFIGLPESHSENDLQKGLLNDMKKFILEIGKDFLFVGEEYRVQVGNSDFYFRKLLLWNIQ